MICITPIQAYLFGRHAVFKRVLSVLSCLFKANFPIKFCALRFVVALWASLAPRAAPARISAFSWASLAASIFRPEVSHSHSATFVFSFSSSSCATSPGRARVSVSSSDSSVADPPSTPCFPEFRPHPPQNLSSSPLLLPGVLANLVNRNPDSSTRSCYLWVPRGVPTFCGSFSGLL